MRSLERSEEFELRLFKEGYQLVDAKTNILRGDVLCAPTDPDSHTSEVRPPARVEEPHNFFLEVDSLVRPSGENICGLSTSTGDVNIQWEALSYSKQQHLLPVLQQDLLSDSIRNPELRALDLELPEPKLSFQSLSKQEKLSRNNAPYIPQEALLTFELKRSSVSIYPAVNVTEVIPTNHAIMGLCRTKSNLYFTPGDIIDRSMWQMVGATEFDCITESANGPVEKQYLGVIFDKDPQSGEYMQLGLASHTIMASISVTEPEIPPPKFVPNFDRHTTLRYAQLSQLAYEPYSVVKESLHGLDLSAEMEIFVADSDTKGFIAGNSSTVIVAFCGTDIRSWKNIFTDVWFFRQDMHGVKVHGGFKDAFEAVYESIKETLQPNLRGKKIVMTGHSLGGALASLLTYRLSLEHPNVELALYVYGCPPVGDHVFATYFRDMESHTITIEGDPVSTGKVTMLGPWVGLHKPVEVKYLHRAGGHGIANYIEQLKHVH